MTTANAVSRAGRELGTYRIVSHLASGGMADVWLAETTAPGAPPQVVLKTMRAEVASSRKLSAMFVEEALLAAKLRHENVVRVLEVGSVGGTHFIAMEYVRGRTLRQIAQQLHERQERFDASFLLRVVIGTCAALEYVHGYVDDEGRAYALVHGDVSPENIMVSFAGVVKLVDFGLSRAAAPDRDAPPASEGTVVVGKPWYMAPECFGSGVVDRRSDLYSLGIILYEYLTGRRPYAGDTEAEVIAQVLEGKSAAPHDLASGVPRALAATTLRAMARDPDARFGRAPELAAALERHVQEIERSSGASSPSLDLHMMRLFGEREAVSSSVRFSPTGSARARAAYDADLPTTPTDPAALEAALSLVDEAVARHAKARPSGRFPRDEAPTRKATIPAPAPDDTTLATASSCPTTRTRSRTADVFGAAARPPRRAITAYGNAIATPRTEPRTQSGAWGPISEQKLEAAHLFDEGLSAMASGDLDRAQEAWRRALELDPSQRRYEANLRRLTDLRAEKRLRQSSENERT